jgi:uncharacterized protein (TIGR00296 family)
MKSIWEVRAAAVLRAARQLFDATIANEEAALPALPPLPDVEGLFVTLYDRAGEVRGSIGSSGPIDDVAAALVDAVRRIVRDDPRFPPLGEDEVEGALLAITLLRAGQVVQSADEIELGTTALFVRRGLYSGLTLPEVAAGRDWDRRDFWAFSCRRAGLLHALDWQDGATEVIAYPTVRAAEDRTQAADDPRPAARHAS